MKKKAVFFVFLVFAFLFNSFPTNAKANTINQLNTYRYISYNDHQYYGQAIENKSTNTFVDVSESNIYYDAINYLHKNNIIHGYPDGSFKPLMLLNRAELLKMAILSNYHESEIPNYNNNCFQDISLGQWYSKYVCFAKDKGIVDGYNDGFFRPEQSINFVEAMKIVSNSFGYTYSPASYPWYRDLIEEASEKNLIPLNVISFDQKINRGQLADTMTRAMHYKSNSMEEYLGPIADINQTYESIENEVNNIKYYWQYLVNKQTTKPLHYAPEYKEKDYIKSNSEIRLLCQSPCPIESEVLDKKFMGILSALSSVKSYYNQEIPKSTLPITIHLNKDSICNSQDLSVSEVRFNQEQGTEICLYEYEKSQKGNLEYPLTFDNADRIENQLLVMKALTRVILDHKTKTISAVSNKRSNITDSVKSYNTPSHKTCD